MGDPLSPEKLLEILRGVVLEAAPTTLAAASTSSTSSSSGQAVSGEEQTASSSTASSSNNDNSDHIIIIKNSTSLISLLIHSIHTSLGFRQTRPTPPKIDSEGNNTSQEPLERNKITKEWFNNCSNEESFYFEYRHDQSSLVFQVRIGRLGGRTVVNAVAVEVS